MKQKLEQCTEWDDVIYDDITENISTSLQKLWHWKTFDKEGKTLKWNENWALWRADATLFINL